MKHNRLQTACLALLLLALVPAALYGAEKEFKFPVLRDLKVPAVETGKLPSGMTVYFLEDHQVPLVRFYLMIHTGTAYDPPDRVGLAAVAMELIRSGGITGKSGDELDQVLDSMGASIETSVDATSASISATCLPQDAPAILEYIDQMLRDPALAQDKLDLIKTQLRSAISRRNDNPAQIADREFQKLVYGENSPYARQMEYAHLDRITRDDVAAFCRRFFQPDYIHFGCWGDFKTPEMKGLAEKLFGNWKGDGRPAPVFPAVTAQPAAPIRLVVKNDVNQSNIRLGHVGITMDNPDYFAVEMMNSVFGSNGFLSRLMQIVRTEKGLTYGIRGAIGSEMAYPGLFDVGTSTKSESTVDAIQTIEQEIRRIQDQPVTQKELDIAKEAFLNSFVFRFESSFRFLVRRMNLAYYNYPPNFLETFKDNVAKVTVADVQRVAREYLHPDRLVVLVVGKPADFVKPLDTLGTVQELDIAIPPPPSSQDEAPAATPAALAKGKLMVGRLVEAMKAADALDGLTAMHMLQDLTLKVAPQMEIAASADNYLVLPDKLYSKLSSPMFTLTRAFDGKAGWMVSPQGAKDFSEDEIKDARENIERTPLVFLKGSLVEGFQAIAVGKEEIQGKSYDVVYIPQGEGKGFRIGLDPETGMLGAMVYTGKRGPEPGKFIQIFTEPTAFGPIQYPAKSETFFNGEKYMGSTIKSIELNPAVPEDLFKKPAQ